MMGRRRRTCPLCGKENLLHLYTHLRDVHNMKSSERAKWLKRSYSHGSQKHNLSQDDLEENQTCSQTKPSEENQTDKPWWETQSLLPFKARSSMLISGQSNSGKSYFINKLLQNIEGMYEIKPEAIMFCYAVWQPLYDEMEQNIPNITFHQGLPTQIELNEFTTDDCHKLIIFDDMINYILQSPSMEQLFTCHCHHYNISVIIVSQNLFQAGKHSRTIALNTSYIVLFQQNRDLSQIAALGRQIYPGKGKVLVQAYTDAMKSPYNYLVIDLSPNSNPKYRLRTQIFPNQDIIVYVPVC